MCTYRATCTHTRYNSQHHCNGLGGGQMAALATQIQAHAERIPTHRLSELNPVFLERREHLANVAHRRVKRQRTAPDRA